MDRRPGSRRTSGRFACLARLVDSETASRWFVLIVALLLDPAAVLLLLRGNSSTAPSHGAGFSLSARRIHHAIHPAGLHCVADQQPSISGPFPGRDLSRCAGRQP
jgi:hypothetical protein